MMWFEVLFFGSRLDSHRNPEDLLDLALRWSDWWRCDGLQYYSS